MKYYTVEFDDEKKTGLKIFFDPDDPNQWKNIKICKTEGGEDTREWLKLVFENASENMIYVYIVPVENKSNVENRIIIHIDYNGAEQEIYSRDICRHICEVIKCDEESGIVNYTSDINALKLNTNKSFSDTAKDLENMKKKL